MKIVNQLEFNYKPYEEDIFITGMPNTRKTTRVKKILNMIQNCDYWIWSPQKPEENYGAYGNIVRDVSRLTKGHFIFAGSTSDSDFEKYLERALKFRNLVLVMDDLQENTTKQRLIDALNKTIQSGRNKGISNISITPRPQNIPNFVMSRSSHIFAHRLNLESEVQWMRKNFFGDDAWILLSKHLRPEGIFDSPNDIEFLPDGAFLYRKIGDRESQLFLPSD